jgi:hypothetical protein
MPLNVGLSVGCSGTWVWAGPNNFDVGLANNEAFSVILKSVEVKIDGIPGAILTMNNVQGVMRESGVQDLDFIIPLPFNPPNPPAAMSYDIMCSVTVVVTKVDGTESTTLTSDCMCTVSHSM